MNRIAKRMLLLLCGVWSLTAAAQEKIHQVDEITVINYGDGRLLFREATSDKTPLQGEHRIIDGYRSEYILAGFKDGMYDGKYRHFKRNLLAEESDYKEGRLEGERKQYYGDGETLQSHASFVGGKLNGVIKNFFRDGKVETEKEYKMGVEDGFDHRYDSEGKLVLDQFYKAGRPDGKWVEHIVSNVGNYTRICYYKDGLRQGEWTETWENGSPRNQTSYKDGKKDGKYVTYSTTGNPLKSIGYKNDEKDGEEISYYTNGKIEKSVGYAGGKRNGLTREYFYDSGKLKSEYHFKNGLLEGDYKRFYEDGKLREEGRCEKDYEVYRKEYYDNGQLKSVAERDGGAWNTIERYNPDGSKK